MSVVEAIPGRPGNKRNAAAPMGGDEGSAFFGLAIDIRGNRLPVPMQLLRRVRLVVNVDGYLLTLCEAKQGPRTLAIVGGRGNDAIRCKFNRLDGDGEVVRRRTVVLAFRYFRLFCGALGNGFGGT